jgi:hypothetical protein
LRSRQARHHHHRNPHELYHLRPRGVATIVILKEMVSREVMHVVAIYVCAAASRLECL